MRSADGVKLTICARSPWNRTGFRVSAGQSYRFVAVGRWCDASNCCGADGYESSSPVLKVFERRRRVKNARWFALIGSVGGKYRFVIGSASEWTAPANGELWCFANDVRFMYWNNAGAVNLTVTER